MSGGRRNDEKDNKQDQEGGWASTFFKIAGAAAATAAVVGGLYSVLNQPQAEVVGPYGTPQPDRDVVILKVDGSLRYGKAGCGGYLSSASQKWICGFALKLNPSLKPNETERDAILTGLKWVQKMRKRKIEVKSDCKTVVDLVNSRSACKDPVICEIRDLRDRRDWEVEVSWIRGNDQNKVADKLADIGRELTSVDLDQFDDPPPECVRLL